MIESTLITMRHMDHTESIDQIIRQKMRQIQDMVSSPLSAQWTCWTEKLGQTVEVKINGGKTRIFAKATSQNLYKSIDLVVKKLKKQVRRSH